MLIIDKIYLALHFLLFLNKSCILSLQIYLEKGVVKILIGDSLFFMAGKGGKYTVKRFSYNCFDLCVNTQYFRCRIVKI